MTDLGPWSLARDALRLLALDPTGMGGLWLRSRPGPARDAMLAALGTMRPRRLHPGISQDALEGGIDLARTLATGALHHRPGLLSDGALVCLTMAERCSSSLAGRIGQAMDTEGVSVIALDEAADADETLPPALADRLGLFVNLEGLALSDIGPIPTAPLDPQCIARYHSMTIDEPDLRSLVETAAILGITSMRAPLLAARAGCGLAALDGRTCVTGDDLTRAVALTLAHRGDPPSPAQEQDPPPPSENDAERGDHVDPETGAMPSDLLVEAALACLPPDLLRQLAAGRQTRAQSTARGSGSALRSNRRGRPLPPRAGRLEGSARLDVSATLRAAAPWQTLRAASGPDRLLHLRSDDFRIKRYEQKSDRLLIFTVDASGSQAMARLSEVKGAIEILLSQAYARRDHVCLISFRGEQAELLLPPTRSLVQTKRRLAGLPGGGGTPLAAGLVAARDLAVQSHGRGFTPSIVLLTDGRANIDLTGRADRAAAHADAMQAGAAVGATCPGGLVIDTGRRSSRELADIADRMVAHYLALPRADTARLGLALAPVLAD